MTALAWLALGLLTSAFAIAMIVRGILWLAKHLKDGV